LSQKDMPISGLLLTLKPSAIARGQTLAALQGCPQIQVGQLFDRWLPIAVDASGDAACRELHDWIASLPAIEFVDVVSVNFEDDGFADSAATETISPEAPLCR
jgi:hypothetical protein